MTKRNKLLEFNRSSKLKANGKVRMNKYNRDKKNTRHIETQMRTGQIRINDYYTSSEIKYNYRAHRRLQGEHNIYGYHV